MSDPLPGNLAHACSLYPSIAHVCRRIGLNRQQFNKYLAGQVRPSRHNMRKICDFFGVTEAELLMDEARFSNLLSLRRPPPAPAREAHVLAAIKRLSRASGSLDRYLGCYYRYFYSFGFPGQIIRSFAVLSRQGDDYLWRNFERGNKTEGRACEVYKYTGMAFLLGDRLTVIEYEALLAGSVTQMTLYPSYRSGLDYLIGLQTGAPRQRGRKPAASTVMLEYLGQHVDLRRALAQCGTFDPQDLPARVETLVANRMPAEAWVFEIDQL